MALHMKLILDVFCSSQMNFSPSDEELFETFRLSLQYFSIELLTMQVIVAGCQTAGCL